MYAALLDRHKGCELKRNLPLKRYIREFMRGARIGLEGVKN